jgi:hypothetical protein
VQSVLRESGPAGPAEASVVVVAGLADACGLGWRLWPYASPQARRYLQVAVAQLDPGLREVITQTQAAVDGAVLSHRV